MAAEVARLGLFIHSVAIRPSNVEKSLWFYKTVLGLQETMHVKEDSFEIWLLGYPVVNGSQRERTTIELINSAVEPVAAHKFPPRPGFLKLALGVRDMSAFVAHIRQFDVRIVKDVDATAGLDEVGSLIGLETQTQGRNETFLEMVKSVVFIQDPDGNYIELVPEP
ncbi:uncharacterized protein A1O5_01755 [Cladophialophora psammophila CBS 110553]|uniref:VOC domain-containing protein n=1 Tax=Cladophialophora psammophila CBS 110553 TaxID=1182543 RepID=W9XXR3_9EURO|nr:uncharacterized protein A1O5_01755 [Cladophialophora psammophila CBS 110553]EXJ75059.1 hypothetical protein A1O5_01755 [Cladophialophora psammophila CBS 110553]